MKPINHSTAWQALSQYYANISLDHVQNLTQSSTGMKCTPVADCQISLDYARQPVTDDTLGLLIQLTQDADLQQHIHSLFNGKNINVSENRPALHTALREPAPTYHEVADARDKLYGFTNNVLTGKLTGTTGKTFRHIVNIGIGGSHTGPALTVEALKDFAVSNLKFHFVSSYDPCALQDILNIIDPETTLFIISSKSFSTVETLENASHAINWMQSKLGTKAIASHFVAVTAKQAKARELGISGQSIFPIWEWVGGRFSIWSAIGLPLLLMIGKDHFNAFLSGAHAMDKHFQDAQPPQNLPILLALLGILHINFLRCDSRVVAPYSYRLRSLIAYLQQLEMESNGKSVTQSGESLSYCTAPVVFGLEGSDAQHTYQQLLFQGTRLIPTDFIVIQHAHDPRLQDKQLNLIASAFSQAQALSQGKPYSAALKEIKSTNPSTTAEALAMQRVIRGGQPSSILTLERLTPETLGSLLALYEHKIFVQGVIWGINSFDQWGVELGKALLPQVLKDITSSTQTNSTNKEIT